MAEESGPRDSSSSPAAGSADGLFDPKPGKQAARRVLNAAVKFQQQNPAYQFHMFIMCPDGAVLSESR